MENTLTVMDIVDLTSFIAYAINSQVANLCRAVEMYNNYNDSNIAYKSIFFQFWTTETVQWQ